jgi:DNA (cytosine-5)-methyltransferase 1
MTYGSICSGIAADHLSFEGMDCQWFSEIEKFPCAVLKHHYPDIPNHGDITDGIKKYDAVDLVVGGTPCQGFSVAGKRKGLDDDRSNLALRFLEIVTHTRPQWVVWENVPGVFSTDGGRDFGAFIGELGKRGYGWAYRTLDAQYFGVPQRRRRVFVVGYFGDWRPAAAVLFERHSLQGHSPPSQKEGEDIATATGEGFTPASHGGNRRGTGSLRANGGDLGGGSEVLVNDWISGPLAEPDYKDCGTDGMNKGSAKLAMQVYENHPNDSRVTEVDACPKSGKRTGTGGGNLPLVQRTVGALQERDYKGVGTTIDDKLVMGFDWQRDGSSQEEASATLSCTRVQAVAGFLPTQGSAAKGIGYEEEIAPTLRSGCDQYGLHAEMSVRRLTPRECERLMGFPDDFTRIPYRGKPADNCPDGPRYAALGNSIAIPVLKWIGDRIQTVEELS